MKRHFARYGSFRDDPGVPQVSPQAVRCLSPHAESLKLEIQPSFKTKRLFLELVGRSWPSFEQVVQEMGHITKLNPSAMVRITGRQRIGRRTLFVEVIQ